ncbi:MAG: cytochrome d ubiquinol oxidase subunit II [Burkholderiales bacterium]
MGSLVATLAQGFILGGLLSGMPVSNGQFTGGYWDWLNPFSILVTLGGAAGFVLLGTTYFAMKTEGAARDRSIKAAGSPSVRRNFASLRAISPLSRSWSKPARWRIPCSARILIS